VQLATLYPNAPFPLPGAEVAVQHLKIKRIMQKWKFSKIEIEE